MAHGVNNKTGSSFLVVALAAILILGGVLAACSRATTTTSAPAPTSTSVTTRTTTSSLSTTTSAPSPTATSAPTATGVSAADFYKANVVTVVVPYGPGGSADYVARLFANYWTDVTDGRMIIDNRAGGSGFLGTNYAYAAKPDGLMLGVGFPGSTLISPTLAQDPAVKFDIKKMNWIEFVNPEAYVLGISAKLPYASMESLSKVKGLKFASDARSSNASFGAGLIIEFFGLQDARIVLGYGGSAEIQLAVGKGEVDGYVTISSVVLDGIGKGFFKQPFLSWDFERGSYFPDAPAVPELLKLSPEQENLLRTFAALVVGQVFWTQPGVPQDRIAFVRNAFDKIVANENFVKQAKTRWPVWVKPTSGKDYAAQVEKILAVATPERFNELQKLADKYIR